jgi:sugar-specific transcriptional regulator TrmB
MVEIPNRQELTGALQSLGLTEYETRTYLSLLALGIADARTLCENANVPSSKIYSIMNKFQLLGLTQTQQSKPAKFNALDPSIGLMKLLEHREKEIHSLKDTVPLLESELREIYSTSERQSGSSRTFFNLEFGMKNHFQKHLAHLANARSEILSYLVGACLSGAKIYGQAVKQDIMAHIIANKIRTRIILGVQNRKHADDFLRGLPESKHIQIRITEQMHAPFHVIDGKMIITVIDNPLIKDGRIASLYSIDNSLAKELRDGYGALWNSARPV